MLGALWSESRPEPPPWPPVVDRVLAAVLAAVAIAEGVVREDLVARPLQVAFTWVLVGTVAFRRTHPLAATAVGFGLATAATALQVLDGPQIGLHVGVALI